MDAISALFSDWASGLSGGGGGGSLSVVAVSRMSISTPEGVCERGGESMGAEATPRNTRSPAREETTGGTRSGRTLCGWSGEAGGSEGRSEYDQLGERHGASEHETAYVVSEGGESEDPSSWRRFAITRPVTPSEKITCQVDVLRANGW